MGFDLTGYEEDSISLSAFGIYTILGIFSLLVVIFALSFYFFIEKERIYTEAVLEREVQNTIEYKSSQFKELNSYGQSMDDDKIVNRIPIDKAIKQASEHYND